MKQKMTEKSKTAGTIRILDVKQIDDELVHNILGEKSSHRKQDKTKWVNIDYSVIPKRIFDKYGIKPFQIMKRKMRRENGEVWNNINFFDAIKEADKIGCRLFGIREVLVLLEAYKQNKNISIHDKEFLGIEELSYDENVYFEWIKMNKNIAFIRGGHWDYGAYAGSFALDLANAPSHSGASIGFRCCRDLIS